MNHDSGLPKTIEKKSIMSLVARGWHDMKLMFGVAIVRWENIENTHAACMLCNVCRILGMCIRKCLTGRHCKTLGLEYIEHYALSERQMLFRIIKNIKHTFMYLHTAKCSKYVLSNCKSSTNTTNNNNNNIKKNVERKKMWAP